MLQGKTEARIFTQPLRPLTPETTHGYAVIEFAKVVCGITLHPWQQWLLIRMMELNPDQSQFGTYRFRRVVIPVGRQSGKTTLLKVLALWFMANKPGALVLGVAQDLSMSKNSWESAVELCERRGELLDLMPDKNPTRRTSGDIHLRFRNGSKYKIAAANGSAGRGLSVTLLILDELREMKTWEAYQALAPTTAAQEDGMVVCISNAGEHDSVVLNTLQEIGHAGTEPSVGVFEWSAPEGCALDDPEAWEFANPGLGYTVQEAELRTALATFPPDQFRIEHLCQRVVSLDAPINLAAWKDCADSTGTMESLRDRVALCVDVSPSLDHVSLVAAAISSNGKVRLEAVAGWDSVADARRDLPGLIASINPKVVGWYGNGPGATLTPDLKGARRTVEITSGEVTTVCQGLAEQVLARQIVHANDPLLNKHIESATRMPVGDGWRFARRGREACDAAYAVAGAVHLARTMTSSVGKQRIVFAA